ncbi:hypothetical protein [Salarchaeum japonicum]|uniref:hypothetical protein n=1 Tax=Salarchaeum japonicum TaxID=555573 RepID=UPI003C71895D
MNSDVLDDFLAAAREQRPLRVAVHYDGDDYTVLYRRDDIANVFTDEEFDEIVKNAILKGLDETPEQGEFTRWGTLDMTARWFNEILLIHVPIGEWEGLIVSFDRGELSDYGDLVNELLAYVDAELRDEESSEVAAEEHFS